MKVKQKCFTLPIKSTYHKQYFSLREHHQHFKINYLCEYVFFTRDVFKSQIFGMLQKLHIILQLRVSVKMRIYCHIYEISIISVKVWNSNMLLILKIRYILKVSMLAICFRMVWTNLTHIRQCQWCRVDKYELNSLLVVNETNGNNKYIYWTLTLS